MKRKKLKAWLCEERPTKKGRYNLYAGPCCDLMYFGDMWALMAPGARWLETTEGWNCLTAREIRRQFRYAGPLPKPGMTLRVTVEVPE